MNEKFFPNRRKISSKEVRDLLTDQEWRRDEAMSKLFVSQVYMHPDGRVLTVFFNKRGMLYATQRDFTMQVDQFKERDSHGRRHILKDRLPGGKEFPNYAPQLVNELAELLKISTEELDRSLDSLAMVEKKVKRLGKAKCVEPPIFPSLVAYIGEVMRQAVNGRWEMILSYEDGETWEPWIFDSQGRSCNSFSFLYDVLTEDPLSIQGTTGVEINSRYVRTFSRTSPDPTTSAFTVSSKPLENKD